VGFFAGIGFWSANAPLTSAAVAPGSIGLDARRKTIQHLEGGILAELHVSEGDFVEAGDLLLALDDTIAKSTLELLQGQYVDMLALRARMTAERVGAKTVETPEEILKTGEPARVEQAMAAQRNIFESRRHVYQSRTEILNAKIVKLQEQIKGFDAQSDALERQMDILQLETIDIEELVDRGLERAPRLYALQREAARFEGMLGDLAARRSEAEVLIDETRLMLLELEAELQNQVAGELSTLSGRISDMRPRLHAAADKLARSQVRAPVSGRIVTLARHTIGGVIGPGQPILEIVPADLELLVEARVSPVEIDVVRPGLAAEVRLTAYSARSTPTVPGRVVHVSADRLTDPVSGFPYYAVHVRLDAQSEPGATDIDLTQLYPGMPVEVMLVTGRRTVLDYLLQPITDVLARTFRET
jgi:HlyD family type I secretion membrane fusion protein